jgi:hypothetical protein
MRLLLILLVLMLGGSCAHIQEQSVKPVPVAAPSSQCRYQVVYRRDRGTWVDPAFVAIERRGEYWLELGACGRKGP